MVIKTNRKNKSSFWSINNKKRTTTTTTTTTTEFGSKNRAARTTRIWRKSNIKNPSKINYELPYMVLIAIVSLVTFQ
jgi:hypothetical protein